MAISYAGTIRNKSGKAIDAEFAETRESAARALFARHPKAQTVSTSRAGIDYRGALVDTACDIQWINRRDLDKAEARQ